jgi:NAD(P)-dependent dehydrogenase (short-subunit alcohol dehydrogenase family)
MSCPPWSLAGRTVLLTGAAGAVGKAAAATFTEAGATVIGLDRNQDVLDDLVAAGALAGSRAGDLTDTGFLDQVVAAQPEVDVLVNNVGAGSHTGDTDRLVREVTAAVGAREVPMVPADVSARVVRTALAGLREDLAAGWGRSTVPRVEPVSE